MNESETKEAGREDMREKEGGRIGGLVRGSKRMSVSLCFCACVCVRDGKEEESEKSGASKTEKKPRSPQSLQSGGLMHIQLSISPHCPSFLINALLVGVNKHIHCVPPQKTAHCVSKLRGSKVLTHEESTHCTENDHFRYRLAILHIYFTGIKRF